MPKKPKPIKDHKPKIKELLGKEKPYSIIANEIGLSYKKTKAYIKRWKLEKNLKQPVLIGVS